MRPHLLGLIAPICLSSLTLQAPALAQTDHVPVTQQTERALGLHRSLPVSVGIQPANGRIYAIVESAILLEFSWHSVRSPKYRLLVEQADGSIVPHRAEPVRTLRGHVVGMPGTVIAASLVDRGITARIQTARGEDYWLQPVPAGVPGAGAGRHVLYRGEDVIKGEHTCGNDALRLRVGVAPVKPIVVKGAEGSPGSGTRAPMESSHKVAELACDADFEYYQRWGSVSGVVNRIESVINTMNLQYVRDVGIEHQITAVVVRTGSRPYKSSDALTLLRQFRKEWNSKQAGIPRDVAQLFTGKNLNGSTIGIAWIGTVCIQSYAYSVVQSDFSSAFACATDLSAHELGHSWNADHCSCSGHTMNPVITCANQFHGTYSIPEIVSFRNSRSCLGGGGGGGGTPTSVQASVNTSTQGAGKGLKRGRAVVVVTDNLGTPVSGAQVTGGFSGDYDDGPFTQATDSNGSVTFVTSSTVKGKPSVTFCVTAVVASLPWSQSPEVCDSN